ncbi:unnamed protein product [Phaedon cochleariae]|uniref:Transcription initiation factor IIA subunit 1 n=1 Tax=Phaedon cochleariae TaxID=80249 RepID=A0A9P0GLE9_PHACE|nr:unnamed protein product [Phaedon cochleariae]
MSSSLCKASVYKAYQDVINDVISNTREHFIEDGVDEAVLQELKQLWETKLTATKAVEENKELDKVIGVNNNKIPKADVTNNGPNYPKNTPMTFSHQVQMPHHQQQQLLNKQVVGQVPPNNHMPQGQMGSAFPEWRLVPIQLTIPSAPGTGEGPRILSIDVPEMFLQGPHLKSILTGQVISTTMGLPLQTACAFLQEHVNAAFIKHQQTYFTNTMNPLMSDGLHDDQLQSRLRGIPQGDGPADSSDEDDQSEERSENDMEEDKEEDDLEDDDGAMGPEDDPLNSGDDVSDADGTEESFETDNVIVCQYDKITRSRNRWKFHLKDGIMNLKGQDFIFQKANGDAEW